jgi:hypothetical protein
VILSALLLIVAGLGLVAAWAGGKVGRAWTCLSSATAHLHAVEALAGTGGSGLTKDTLIEAGDDLRGLRQDLGCLRAESRPFLPLARQLGWLPGIGPDVASAPDLLDMGQALTDGGTLVFDALSPLLTERPDLAGMADALQQARPTLDAAQSALAGAAAARARIQAEDLSPRLERMVTATDRALPLLLSGVEAARLAPELLGSQGARTYLLLAQNDDERRPTGGWISGAGLVRVDGGKLEVLGFRDSFAVDNLAVPHEPAPESMLRTLWAEMWLFRDSNWSPDFPTAARKAEQILLQDQGIAVDGVIAVDQEALRLLVTALEPLSLPSSAEQVTGQSVVSLLRQRWSEPRPGVSASGDWSNWEAHRKDVLAELMAAMVGRIQTGAAGIDAIRLAEAARRALEQRHVLIALHNPEAAALLAERGWDGAIVPSSGDYLQVVDANVGFNKVDSRVPRTIAYDVDATDPARLRASAVAHYENKSPAEPGPCRQRVEWEATYPERMAGCFWNYVRFYRPDGTELAEANREPLPAGSLLADFQFVEPGDAGPVVEPAEEGRRPFGLFFALAPGQSREVRMDWALPAGTVSQDGEGYHYRLLAQKQSGTPGVPLRVTVTLPAGARLVRATPEPALAEGNVLVFDLVLDVDREVEVVWQ